MIEIADILRAQKGRQPREKPLEPDYWLEFTLLMMITGWGLGYRHGELLLELLK